VPSPPRDDLPYRIEKVLHSGGLYAAEDARDGTRVVLKEAGSSDTAIARLRHEHAILERLAGITGVPQVHDYFIVDNHHFLALRRLGGRPLSHVLARRSPWCATHPDQHDFTGHARWAVEVHSKLTQVVAAMREHGVVHGDLHLTNILLLPGDDIALIDFGSAAVAGDQRPRAGIRHGFVAPCDRTGFDLDRYALACIALALFLPMTSACRFDTGRAWQLANAISHQFPVPADFLAHAVATIEGTGDGSEITHPPQRRTAPLTAHHEAWQQARGALTAAIVASATLERDDCLFPGHFDELTAGGLGIAHGAAGVLYALAVTDCGRYPSFEDWLIERALRPDATARRGLYDGLHGVAHVMHRLGREQRALDMLDRCLRTPEQAFGVDLFGGLSGIGLNLLRFAQNTADSELLAEALRIADEIADSAEPAGPRGLMYGWSGPALFFVRLYRHIGDSRLLGLARTMLRWDLMEPAQPGLARGTTGIALAAEEYLTCQEDEELAHACRVLRDSVRLPGHETGGLLEGSAGTLAYLSRRFPPGRAVTDPPIAALSHRLAWHSLSYQRSLAFPGGRPVQLPMDLANGAAGILLALGTALHHRPVGLPLLEP
jgi:hypothetical protein